MDAITVAMMVRVQEHFLKKPKEATDFRVMVSSMMVVAMFFMLRADEALHVRVAHVVQISGRGGTVTLDIPKEKNNQEERRVQKKLQCVCHVMSS